MTDRKESLEHLLDSAKDKAESLKDKLEDKAEIIKDTIIDAVDELMDGDRGKTGEPKPEHHSHKR